MSLVKPKLNARFPSWVKVQGITAALPEAAFATRPLSVAEVESVSVGRLLSLDVFRGITIAAMLLVNNPGNWSHVYAPLRHAEWHGWTPTDLIFPFFLFIVGVAMTFSFKRQIEQGRSRLMIYVRAMRRALILFALGLIIHGFPRYDLATIRIPGVLQRIALAFVLATPVVLRFRVRGIVITIAALLLGYWVLLTCMPVPGVGAGVLEPGRDLGAYLDRLIFGPEHLSRDTRTWDANGLLGTLPAIVSVLLGVLAGYWIRGTRRPVEKAVGLLVMGALTMVLGLTWSTVFPINKNLWTSSYALFAGGAAMLFLALCYWLVDVRSWYRWTRPFAAFGVNAIAVYFFSELLVLIMYRVRVGTGAPTIHTALYDYFFASWLAPVNASLAFAVVYVMLWLAAAALLYRNRLFLKF